MESVLKAHNKLAFAQGQLFIIAFYFRLLICKDQVKPGRQRLPQYPLSCQQRGLGSVFKREGNPYDKRTLAKETDFISNSDRWVKPKNAHLCVRAESKTTG